MSNMKKLVRKGCHLLRRTAKAIHVKELYYRVRKPFSHRTITGNVQQARKDLEVFSARPVGSAINRNKVLQPPVCDLQIIIPAYNVEAFLKDCMDSVLAQKSGYSFRVTLIDDGSTDGTAEIADSYAKDPRVQVIHQENKGLSGARNTGLQSSLCGSYIMFVDSDDKLMPGAIEALLTAALEANADIVEGGCYNLYEEQLLENYRYSKKEEVTALGNLHGYPWGKVYKRRFWENLHFPEGYWFEDSINSFLIFPQARKVVCIPEMVYAYRQNLNSITHTAPKKPKCVDTYWITEQMMQEYELLELPVNENYYKKMMSQIILNARRVQNMPERVQEDIFILSGELVERYLKKIEVPKECRELTVALKNKDYGVYRLYCRTH